MKKLLSIAAALSFVSGGFARIPFASGESPASPAAEATPAAGASAPASNSGQEAFVDLQRVFQEMPWWKEQMAGIKERIGKHEREVKLQQAKLNNLRDELKAVTEGDFQQNDVGKQIEVRKQLEKEVADGAAKLQSQIAETKQQFLRDEAKIYYEAYEQVHAATAEYAKEHGIRVVRRSSSIAYAQGKDDQVDITDRQAVLARVNRPVIYADGPSDLPSGITDAIVERLNQSRSIRP